MLFRTHVLFGVFVWFVLERFIEMPFFVLIFVLVGSVFVDIDSCKSRVGNRFWIRPLQWIIRHRGVVHSFVVAVFLSLLVGSFSLWGGFGFFVGYVSHLVLDCFTPMGVRLFWPLKFRVKGFLKSGSWGEDVLFSLLLLVDVFLFFNSLFWRI